MAEPATSPPAPAEIGLTVAESTPRPPELPRAPRGAPNVLVILLDDTGFAQLGCFGADIATPNIDRLAAGGLSYNRFHVTALCSPTRATLLTGRNHHAVGMGFLSDMTMGFPGYTARIPPSAAMLPRILRDAGWGNHGHRQVAPRPPGGAQRGRAVHPVAHRGGLRALLRGTPRRGQLLGPEPGARPALHRRPGPLRGRLPPQRRSGRPGDRHHHRPQARRSRQAVLLLLRRKWPPTPPTR